MRPLFQKTSAILVLAFVVSPLALACYCMSRPGKFNTSLSELRPPGLYPIGQQSMSHHTSDYSLALEGRYRIGMSRDQVQMNFEFARARLIASESRSDRKWSAVGKGRSELAPYVREFERYHRAGIVSACDIYDDGQYHHVLFFDDAGVLLGVQVFPSFICG